MEAPSYRWESPNGWKSETFGLPPKRFAPDLGFVGREVLHFSPGYFKAGDEQFWTYAFALLVDEPTAPSAERLRDELHTYFVGLGSHLGKKSSSALAEANVTISQVTSADSEPQATQGSRPAEQRFQATVLDPWATGEPVDLHLKVDIRGCPGTRFQAVIVTVSRHPYAHRLWERLAAERDALRCGGAVAD